MRRRGNSARRERSDGKRAFGGSYLAMWRRGERGWQIRSELFVLLTWAPLEAIRERLELRRARADPLDRSDADWAVFTRMKPPEPITRPHFLVNSTVDQRPVTVAQRLHDVVVIEKGLKPGETVVTEGQLRLEQGTRVQPAEPAAPA